MADKQTKTGGLSLTPAQFFQSFRGTFLDRMPRKRFINLATVNIRRINWIIAIPSMVLIVLCAMLAAKFAVVDRITLVQKEQQELTALEQTMREQEKRLESYDVLRHRFAHYTSSGMTEEELARVDRGSVMDLIQRVVLPHTRVTEWSLRENELTLSVHADSLQLVNDLTQHLLFEPMVEYCTVSNAYTVEQKTEEDAGGVEATITALVRTVTSGGRAHE